MSRNKKVHTLVIDTGAVIKNDPPVSTLLGEAEHLVTTPAIVSEIRDAITRSRFETTLRPFLVLQSPSPASIKFVTDFARRTGDLAVLSKPDIDIIALTYQLECERNGGDWRLRKVPGQKGLNGKPLQKIASRPGSPQHPDGSITEDQAEPLSNGLSHLAVDDQEEQLTNSPSVKQFQDSERIEEVTEPDILDQSVSKFSEPLTIEVDETSAVRKDNTGNGNVTLSSTNSHDESVSEAESDGWITPSNLKQKQATDNTGTTKQDSASQHLQVAVITSDYAMQNVILQINLNLLSASMSRIQQIRTHVLRCHACFQLCKDTNKQFCPRCGQATLTRVSCSTNSKGEFKIHLKQNKQWNLRGDRYSIPKPVHGSANGRIKGAGKDGWGNELMLTEDQKEYQAAAKEQKRQRERNLMDEDYLPSILTGDRGKTGGRIRVGAGRNVNSKKR